MNLEEAVLELEAQILEATGRIDEDVNAELKALAAQFLSNLRAGNFRDRTGALRSSMFASVSEDNQLQIGMLFYGYFLSFGVKPSRAEGLPIEVAQQFGVSEGYTFTRKDKNRGIAARGFYPDGVFEQFEAVLANVIQKLEL